MSESEDMPARPQDAAPRRREDPRRARTHERLLQATMDLLRREGRGALSVRAVTRRVGVRHPLFYQHFADMDACLAAAAAHVLERLAPVDRDLRRALLARAVTDRPRLAEHFAQALERWLAERPVLELLLAHRMEPTAMGEAFEQALSQMRSEMTAELWELAVQAKAKYASLDDVGHLADLHLSHWLWALESTVAGRTTDREKLARMLANLYVDTNVSFFERARHPPYEACVDQAFSQEEQEALIVFKKAMREFVQTHTDAEVVQAYGPDGLDGTVAWMMARICEHFLPDAARASIVIAYRVTWQGEDSCHCIVIDGGRCSTQPLDATLAPSLTIAMSLRTFLECVLGARHFDEAYRSGDLALDGDLLLGADVVGWFYQAM